MSLTKTSTLYKIQPHLTSEWINNYPIYNHSVSNFSFLRLQEFIEINVIINFLK